LGNVVVLRIVHLFSKKRFEAGEKSLPKTLRSLFLRQQWSFAGILGVVDFPALFGYLTK
jgi:hypothetical protein